MTACRHPRVRVQADQRVRCTDCAQLLSDSDRVLRAARREPVNTADFLLPDVYDGGKPCTRVPARIDDLEKRGHEFLPSREANRTATYTLKRDAEQGDATAVEPHHEACPTVVAALGAPADPDGPADHAAPAISPPAVSLAEKAPAGSSGALFDDGAFGTVPHWKAA